MKSFVKDLKLVLGGVVCGTIVFAIPTLFSEYVRPFLHHLY
jgi:hypothetical protein